MTANPSQLLASAYQQSRKDLTAYVTRMVVRPAVAEELVQEAALRLLESAHPPTDPTGVRAWLFRVATNLAIDHMRRHRTWRENILMRTRELAPKEGAF